MGQSYEVEELDLHERRALVERFSGDWYTQPKKETDTWIEEIRYERESMGVTLSFGIVAVTEQVVAYQKKRVADHEVLDLLTVDLPEQRFSRRRSGTRSRPTWSAPDFPLDGAAGRAPRRRALADRGAAADRDVRPLGHRRPLDQRSTRRPRSRRSSSTTATPAASASRARATRSSSMLVGDAHRLVSECPCETGCPSCVQSPEVRQPQRAAVEGGRYRADGGDAV